MATMRGRQPSTSLKVSLVSRKKGECWFSCHDGAAMTTCEVPPTAAKAWAMRALSACMSSSTKLRVCVLTKMWSSSVAMRPMLFDVSTVPGIFSLIFTTPCGTCAVAVSKASTASGLMTSA